MPTAAQIQKMLAPHGFSVVPDEGFVALERVHPTDGRLQGLRIFWWGNPRHADKPPACPRAYLVALPYLDIDSSPVDGGRYRIPLVEWPDSPALRVPASQQTRRPWKEVVAEFHQVITAALDAPYEQGKASLEGLGERYQVSWPGGAAADLESR
ncbi:hypothetical protein [Micrococcus luteus]|uniref:hypothetical protein n=1 Tax=Micrococcus luteus TaxID=1270 RepID=UPI003F6E367D